MAKKSIVLAREKKAQLEKDKIDAKRNVTPVPKPFINIVKPPVVEPVVVVKTPEEMNVMYQLEIEQLKAELARVNKENAKAFEIITRQRKEINNLKGKGVIDEEKEKDWIKVDKDAEKAMRGRKPVTIVHRPITDISREFYMDHAGNGPINARN